MTSWKRMKMTPDEFVHEVLWLVDGGCTGREIENAFGIEMESIRRRVQRRGYKLRDITPAWPWRQQILLLDRRLNVLDVAMRQPLATAA